MSRLAEFGKDKEWERPSLSDCVGYVMELIEREAERTEGRKHGCALDLRIDVVVNACELLQVAEMGDVKIMRDSLRALKQGNA